MAQLSREANKDRFKTGMVPTQGDYVNLIDSTAILTHDQNSGSFTLSGSLTLTGSMGGDFSLSSSQAFQMLNITSSNISSSDKIVGKYISASTLLKSDSALTARGEMVIGTENVHARHTIFGNVTSSGTFLIKNKDGGGGSYDLFKIMGDPAAGSLKIDIGDVEKEGNGTIIQLDDNAGLIYNTKPLSGSILIGPSDSLKSSGTISSSGMITSSRTSQIHVHDITSSGMISGSSLAIVARTYAGAEGGVSYPFAQKVLDQINTQNNGYIQSSSIQSTWTYFQATHISASAISASGDIEGRFRRPMYDITSNGALSINHAGAYLRCGPHMVTMSLNSDVAFPIGTEIDLIQTSSAGHLLITASDGESVTINSRFELYSASGQFSAISLKKVGTNEWDMIGDLTA